MMKVAEIEEAEKDKMRNKCKKIIDHGITCFINRQLIYNFPEQIFTEAGVISIEHADFDGEYCVCAIPLHFVLLPCSPRGRRCLAL
jgi:T-complex protein 1 subunit beta